MTKHISFFIFITIIFSGCGSKSDLEGDSFSGYNSASLNSSDRREYVDFVLKSGVREWRLRRSLKVVAGIYKLNAPITLPAEAPQEMVILKNGVVLAKMDLSHGLESQNTVSVFGQPLQVAFRDLPQRLEIEWMQFKDALKVHEPLEGYSIGGFKIRNASKDLLNLVVTSEGSARVNQVEQNWKIERVEPCRRVFRSISVENLIRRDFDVSLFLSSSQLNPGAETRVVLAAVGRSAQNIVEWGLLAAPVKAELSERFLFVGRHGVDFNSVPPGTSQFCEEDSRVYAKREMLPTGLARTAPRLTLSPQLRLIKIFYPEDIGSNLYQSQELPVIENFFGLSL